MINSKCHVYRRFVSTVSSQECFLNERSSGILEIILDRPNKRNALGANILSNLESIVSDIEKVRI